MRMNARTVSNGRQLLKPNLLYLGIHQYSLSILPIYFYYLIYHLRGIVTILNMPR
jgi:hypothetical protein